MENKILYVLGGRSFSSKNTGRKISEVIAVWKYLGIKVNTQFGKDLNHLNQVTHDYGSQKHHNSSLRGKKYLQFFINSVSEFKDIIHNRKLYNKIKTDYSDTYLDLVWERSSRLHWAGLKLAKEKKITYVLEWKDHLINYKFSAFKWIAIYIENKKIRQANHIVVESLVLKKALIKEGVNPIKIHVALNAVNADEFKSELNFKHQFIKAQRIPKNHKIIGYLGSYAFYHDTIILIEAAAIVLKEIKDVTFLLVGNGKDYHLCKSKAKDLGILNNGLIMLDGVSKEQVPQILSSIDYSILPGSTDIICPIKIMEYMSAETLVFAPDYACNQEVIKSDSGILFDPKNEKDLASKIILSLREPNLFKDFPQNARKYVQQNLTWEKTWGNILITILND